MQLHSSSNTSHDGAKTLLVVMSLPRIIPPHWSRDGAGVGGEECRGGKLTYGVPDLKKQIQDWGKRGSAPDQ